MKSASLLLSVVSGKPFNGESLQLLQTHGQIVQAPWLSQQQNEGCATVVVACSGDVGDAKWQAMNWIDVEWEFHRCCTSQYPSRLCEDLASEVWSQLPEDALVATTTSSITNQFCGEIGSFFSSHLMQQSLKTASAVGLVQFARGRSGGRNTFRQKVAECKANASCASRAAVFFQNYEKDDDGCEGELKGMANEECGWIDSQWRCSPDEWRRVEVGCDAGMATSITTENGYTAKGSFHCLWDEARCEGYGNRYCCHRNLDHWYHTDCFPGSAKVMLSNGAEIAVTELQPKQLLSSGAAGKATEFIINSHEFDPGFDSQQMSFLSFLHERMPEGRPLLITAKHMLQVQPSCVGAFLMATADNVQPDDCLQAVCSSGMCSSKVQQIQTKMSIGRYSPITSSGTLIVEGVAVSSYTRTGDGMLEGMQIWQHLQKLHLRLAHTFNLDLKICLGDVSRCFYQLIDTVVA